MQLKLSQCLTEPQAIKTFGDLRHRPMHSDPQLHIVILTVHSL